MRRFNLGYFIVEGAQSIISHGLMSFAAVCMIVACLLIMGSFSLVAVNAERMLGDLESENIFLAYIEETYTDEQIQELRKRIEAIDNVAEVTFISKAEAKATFLVGRDNALFRELPDEVFRDRFSIHVKDIQLYQNTVNTVKMLEGVGGYRAETEVAKGFIMVRNVAAGIATILVVILVVISFFIISNTTRMATFARREEIAIMKMCGATNSFIRWPFVVEGLILGVVGALVAFFAQWGIYTLICRAVENANAMSFIAVIPFGTLARSVLLTFLGAGAIIGVGGSSIALRRFLQV